MAGDSRGNDFGVNAKVVRQTMESIKAMSPQPQFMLMLGDLVDSVKTTDEMKKQLANFKSIITEYYPIDFFYPGIGNHEMMNGVEGHKAFFEVFSEFQANFLEGYERTVYYFDHGNTRFFMLNSDFYGERHLVSDTQREWLKSNLQTSKVGRNFFFIHEPAYPTGANAGSSLDYYRLERNKLWEVVDSASSPLFFCSHEHNYTRRHIDSSFNETVNGVAYNFKNTVYQITTGGFGAPLYTEYSSKKNVNVPPVVAHHYVVV
ncbi:MAG: metallophosphoesterase, partial [Clostridiales bacterium]|nr:metallophosphoesterase [Clostridiales bacterium]